MPGALQAGVDGKPIKPSPGMSLTAEIKAGEWQIVESLLSPVQRATSKSLRGIEIE